MRVSSGDREYRSVRSDSDNPVRSDSVTPGTAESGVGWDGYRSRKRSKGWKPELEPDRPPFEELKAKQLAFARKHLPREHGPYVAVAIDSLKMAGIKVTTGSVMARLKASGRDHAARVERDKRRSAGGDAA